MKVTKMQLTSPAINQPSLNRTAFSATVHCLTGCAIGEILGMFVGISLSWGNWATVALSVTLAFVFGYTLTLIPVLRANVDFQSALGLVFASDTISIAVMEVIDNAIMLMIPGAMNSSLTDPIFWSSMTLSLLLAGLVAFPVNRLLISRNRGHAVVHNHHKSNNDTAVHVMRAGTRAPEQMNHSHH